MLIDLIGIRFAPQGQCYLFKAPVGSGLKVGDMVTLQDTNDIGTVCGIATPVNEEDSSYLNLIRQIMRMRDVPTKWVTAKVVLVPLERDEPL